MKSKTLFPVKITASDLDYLKYLQEPVYADKIVKNLLRKDAKVY